jgi:hypothetical protein
VALKTLHPAAIAEPSNVFSLQSLRDPRLCADCVQAGFCHEVRLRFDSAMPTVGAGGLAGPDVCRPVKRCTSGRFCIRDLLLKVAEDRDGLWLIPR